MDFDDLVPSGGQAGTATLPPQGALTFDDLVPAPDPATQGQQYLSDISSGQTPLPATPQMLEHGADGVYRTSALGRDAKAIGGALFSNTATPDYSADEGGFTAGLRKIPLAGPLLANIGHGIGNIASSAYDKAGDIATEVGNAYDNEPNDYIAAGKAGVALGTGIIGGAYNLVNPIANTIEKGAKDAISDGMRATGYGDAAANFEAQKDFDRLTYEQNYEHPALAALNNLSGLPNLSEGVANIAPLLLPAGAGLETAGLAAKAGGAIGDAVENGINLAGKGASAAAPLIGGAKGIALGGPVGGYFGLKAGARLGDVLSSATPRLASGIGDTTGRLATMGINAASPAATGLALGLGSADPGQEQAGASAGLAQGALFSPITAAAGTFARQDLEQAALAKQAAIRGMPEYGNNPDLDAATARGIASLDPEAQQAVLQQRGLFRDIQNPEGKQIQIHVPDDYAARAQAANGGTVDDAANSRGFYLDGQGGVFINPDAVNSTGALQEALGHETGHSVYQDALPGVNDRAATRLTNAVTNSALDDNLQPTPDFQAFANQYATAANGGTPTAVDWNKLPVSGPGLTRNYLLNELGAETVRAATPDVGAQLAGPELSDHIANFTSDLATRLGLKAAPNATAVLGADGQPVPISTSALQVARTGSYAIGAKAADSFGSPVRISEPEKVSKPSQSSTASGNNTQQPIGSAGQQSTQAASTIPSPQTDTSFRQTPAYQDAFAVATLNKKFGGLGVKPSDAQTLLDRAAQDLGVPDTNTDYVGYVKKATTPTPATVPVPPEQPNIAPALPVAPPSDAPNIAPTVNKTVPTEPPLTVPPVEPINRFTDTRPEPATDPRDVAEVSNPPLNSPPESTLPATEEAQTQTAATEVPKAAQEQTGAANPAQAQENPSPASTAIADANPAPLSKDDIARIEAETESKFTPSTSLQGIKGTPAERTARRAELNAQALAAAKGQAVADAHAAALEPGDTRVQMKVDENGKRKISGTHFVDDDPFHQRLIGGDNEAATRETLPNVQDAIRNGELLNYDYDSAAEGRSQQTAKQRRESQAASSASDRASGIGDIQLQNKSLLPFSVTPHADGSVGVYGFSPEKMLGNAEQVFKALRDNDMADRLPYRDVNDPLYIKDVQDGIENHANGYSLQGNRLAPVEGVNVPEPTPGYEPHVLPPARANFINLTMGQDQTLKSPTTGKVPRETDSGKLRRFAAANDNVPAKDGEVNPLRAELNAKKLLVSGPDEGSKDLLHSVFETNRADLMSNFRDPTLPVDFTAQRGASFRGDRTQLVPGGKTPNSSYSGAGFLPSIVRAGEQIPGTTGRAAEDLPVQRFGNATVTGAGTQFLPAYHGTPHEVDKFDSSKIGTGEGAQVYGHGLYFAENKEVANQYKEALSDAEMSADGQPYDAKNDRHFAGAVVAGYGGRTDEAVSNLEREAKDYRSRGPSWADAADRADNLRKLIKSGDYPKVEERSKGNLYSVDLDVHPDHLLDWDKALSDQSEHVQSALQSSGLTAGADKYFANNPQQPKTAGSFYDFLKYQGLSPREISAKMEEAGIPGIRYLDQGSRTTSGGQILGIAQNAGGWQAKVKVSNRGGAGFAAPTDTITTSQPFPTREAAEKWAAEKTSEGTRNFVMFDDSKIRITHKNDAPTLATR